MWERGSCQERLFTAHFSRIQHEWHKSRRGDPELSAGCSHQWTFPSANYTQRCYSSPVLHPRGWVIHPGASGLGYLSRTQELQRSNATLRATWVTLKHCHIPLRGPASTEGTLDGCWLQRRLSKASPRNSFLTQIPPGSLSSPRDPIYVQEMDLCTHTQSPPPPWHSFPPQQPELLFLFPFPSLNFSHFRRRAATKALFKASLGGVFFRLFFFFFFLNGSGVHFYV